MIAADRILRRARAIFGGLLVVAGAGCFRPAIAPHVEASWLYEVDVPRDGSHVISIEATFQGAGTKHLALGTDSVPHVRGIMVAADARGVTRDGDVWVAPSCTSRCTIRYRVDLDALAEACGDDVHCARRVGNATLSPALAWLVHPVPRADVPVRVHVRAAAPDEFASGMRQEDATGTTFGFRSFDLDEGSYSAFGPMRRSKVALPPTAGPRARLDAVILGANDYAMTEEQLTEWIGAAAGVVSPLFGRFPADHATIFVLPARHEREVIFGKVLSLAGASVVIIVGDEMRAASRLEDWILVHELFHLGFPTFRGEGRWLAEGLATYYTSVLRARAGWTSEEETFRLLAQNLPRGLAMRDSEGGLVARTDIDSIYWGGALFCFAADVRIRQATGGRRSLDDVVRAALEQGGDATRVWTVADVIRTGDEATGTTILSEMYERHALRNEAIDLAELLRTIGVTRYGRIDREENDARTLLRRAIVEHSARVNES